jgi:hypothetical protein
VCVRDAGNLICHQLGYKGALKTEAWKLPMPSAALVSAQRVCAAGAVSLLQCQAQGEAAGCESLLGLTCASVAAESADDAMAMRVCGSAYVPGALVAAVGATRGAAAARPAPLGATAASASMPAGDESGRHRRHHHDDAASGGSSLSLLGADLASALAVEASGDVGEGGKERSRRSSRRGGDEADARADRGRSNTSLRADAAPARAGAGRAPAALTGAAAAVGVVGAAMLALAAAVVRSRRIGALQDEVAMI